MHKLFLPLQWEALSLFLIKYNVLVILMSPQNDSEICCLTFVHWMSCCRRNGLVSELGGIVGLYKNLLFYFYGYEFNSRHLGIDVTDDMNISKFDRSLIFFSMSDCYCPLLWLLMQFFMKYKSYCI